MGKNHRHAKKLKSERNKVHIKSKTQFLPKGQNVTNTTFKIKPIVLQEQLKEVTKKFNINESISKLKHHNDTLKSGACESLREFFQNNPIESVHLGAICQNGANLVQDIDRKVRRNAIKLLHIIFEKVSTLSLRPFFSYILTNLKCAMTHINRNIQDDSLLLLDAILDKQGVLLAEDFHNFFPNFLLLISKLKNKTEHCLTINLEGKITNVKWRAKVLSRLQTLIEAVSDLDQQSHDNFNVTNINTKNVTYIPLYTQNESKVISPNIQLDSFQLVPLLRDIWLEVVPENHVLPTEEAVSIFCSIVHILKIVGNCDRFVGELLKHFPYSHKGGDLMDENLILLSLKKQISDVKPIGDFIVRCLSNSHRISPFGVEILKKVLIENKFKREEIRDRLLNNFHFYDVLLSVLEENHPNYLAQRKISEKFIDKFLCLIRSGQDFNIQGHLKDILDNLENLEIIGCDNRELALKKLAGIFFYVDLKQDDVQLVRDFLGKFPDLEISSYLKDMLALRLYFSR